MSPVVVGVLCLLMLYMLSGVNKIISFDKTAKLSSRDIFNMLRKGCPSCRIGAIVLLTLGERYCLLASSLKKKKG